MKNIIAIAFIIMVAISLAACNSSPKSGQISPSASGTNTLTSRSAPVSAGNVKFTNEALEAKVREAMNKPIGDITLEEAQTITKLDLSNASFDDMNSKNGGIRDITSLKYFTGLEELNLSFNDIKDFSPLSGLTSLKSLGFTGVRPNDLSPLKNLTNMNCLVFDWCYSPDQGYTECSNLDFMADMKNLEIFEAKGAGITDITVLGTLPKLWSVFLDANQITDITPLGNLKNLIELLLAQNPITDYSPVKDIYPKLRAVDFVLN
jgi:internalin A